MTPKIQLVSGSNGWSAYIPDLKDKDGYNIVGGHGNDPAAALFACLEDAARVLIYWNEQRQASTEAHEAAVEAARIEGHDKGWLDAEEFYRLDKDHG